MRRLVVGWLLGMVVAAAASVGLTVALSLGVTAAFLCGCALGGVGCNLGMWVAMEQAGRLEAWGRPIPKQGER